MTSTETRQPEAPAKCVIQMPLGLLGFEQHKRFALLSNPSEDPFFWLQGLDEPKPAFLVISPFVVLPSYQPEIPEEDARYLDLHDQADSLIFNIVTVRGPQHATVNLKGPILLNRRTLLAKQVIPLNAPNFSVACPLPVQGS